MDHINLLLEPRASSPHSRIPVYYVQHARVRLVVYPGWYTGTYTQGGVPPYTIPGHIHQGIPLTQAIHHLGYTFSQAIHHPEYTPLPKVHLWVYTPGIHHLRYTSGYTPPGYVTPCVHPGYVALCAQWSLFSLGFELTTRRREASF